MIRQCIVPAVGAMAIGVALQACTTVPPVPTTAVRGAETSIPFVDQKSTIRNWEADGRDGVWVQDARRNWYYGTLLAPCTGLDFATRIGFVTPGGRLDRFSSVVVEGERGERCPFTSFTMSAKPLPRKEREAAKKAAEAAQKAAAAKPAGG